MEGGGETIYLTVRTYIAIYLTVCTRLVSGKRGGGTGPVRRVPPGRNHDVSLPPSLTCNVS